MFSYENRYVSNVLGLLHDVKHERSSIEEEQLKKED